MIGCFIAWGLSLSITLIAFFTFLYDYPQHHKQKNVWDILLHIKDSISGPWAIVGDLNEILHPHEKIGGNL